MALFTYIPTQNLLDNQPALLNTVIGCNKGYVLHRNGSGIVTLRGIVNNPAACFARYSVVMKGVIAVPTGETPGAIGLAVTLDGEPLLDSVGIVTPTVVDAYFTVSGDTIIDVPRGCCYNIAVEKFIPNPAPATAIPSINSQYLTLEVTRVA